MDSGLISAHMQLLAELEARLSRAAAAVEPGPGSGSSYVPASTSALSVQIFMSISAIMMHMMTHMALVSQREMQPNSYQKWGEILLHAGMAEVWLRVMDEINKLPDVLSERTVIVFTSISGMFHFLSTNRALALSVLKKFPDPGSTYAMC